MAIKRGRVGQLSDAKRKTQVCEEEEESGIECDRIKT